MINEPVKILEEYPYLYPNIKKGDVGTLIGFIGPHHAVVRIDNKYYEVPISEIEHI